MKKLKGYLWLKIVAVLLCSISIITLIASTVFIVATGEISDEKELEKEAMEICREQYSRALLANEYGQEETDITEILDSNNYEYAIIKADTNSIEDINLYDDSIYIVGNASMASKYTNYVIGEENCYYPYQISSFLEAAISPGFIEHIEDEGSYVNGCMYEESTGHFYYSTWDDMLYMIPAISFEDGKDIYYASENGYEKEKLPKVTNKNIDLEKDIYLYDHKGLCQVFNNEEPGPDFTIVDKVDKHRIIDKTFSMAYWDVDDVEDIGCLHIIQDMNYRIVLSNVNPNKAPNKGDLFDQAFGWIEIYKNISDKIYLINILSIFIFALSTFYLCASAGHNNKDEEIHINWFDKIPFEITSFAVIMIIGTGIALFADSWIFLLNALLLSIEIIIGMITISIVYLLSIIRKLKAKSFWKYTLVGIIFKWFKKHLGRRIAFVWNQMRENTPAVGKFILLIIAMLMADLIVGVLLAGPFVYVFDGFGIILLGMILLGANLVPFIYAICQMSILQKAAKNIAEGRLDDPIDTSKMYWEFRKHGDYLNRVSDGISAAVSEKMKSERFKTELITNVSHDIKTPLTSIINYVDLIKKEDVSKPPLDEYIQVLDRQSARLKKLIEDLMEASKASTGNLAVNLEKCNVGVFVTQIVGEFEEKLLGKNLELIINKPDEALEIMADGRHFWRVIDNLMNNICKYAQPGTRVYVNIERDNDNVTLTFLNTSAYQLNISSEELMERFVRGDSSRNTEGSGLGLSIASSLTALMEGEMKLDILGDLFKVTLIFKNAK